jgi:hypothetical protein
MKKYVLIWSLFLCLVACRTNTTEMKKGMVDISKVPIPASHYLEEYTFDKPSDTVSWANQKAGLNVAFGSTDELYLRCEVPEPGDRGQTWEGTGWRGERLNAQVLVWSRDTCLQVRFSPDDLKSKDGRIFSKNNIELNMVRYVLSNFPYGGISSDCYGGNNDSVYLMPDRFEQFERFDLPGMTVRPVWLTVNIPESTEPGIYEGTIEVSSEGHTLELKVKIRVQDLVLPEPKRWSFRLDLWQNPWVVAWYYHVKPWSDEHKMLLRKHLKLYAEAGGTYVTTYAVHSPWSDNSYMIEGTMIEWVKTKDGSWKFDYSIFDQYVILAEEMGIDKAITVYTPVPWGYRFRYLDEASGDYKYEVWAPDSEEFSKVFNIFLDDLKTHLKSKGWLEKTYLGINENPLDVTMAAVKVIRDNSPDWKITYAGGWHPELAGILDDYCTVIGSEPAQEDIWTRRAMDFTTTYYICCTPPKPNTFVFSPPVEAAYLGWYTAAYGYDGFLRWAYDAWPADPMRDARHVLWGAGDCFLVYPGGNSCIRFEKLREGIVDYEKIRILREITANISDENVINLVNDFNKHLETFVGDRDYAKRIYNVNEMSNSIEKGRKLIEEISDDLTTNKK